MEDELLIDEYIEESPHKPGPSNVRLKESCVAVWALIGYWPAVQYSVERVAQDYDLPVEAVRAAIAYYERHRCAIDARLAENHIPVT